jgi:apyrase
MRSLAETEPDRAAQIHAELKAKLRERGHVDVDSRTIEGLEEARWAWIAANLMVGSLGDASVGILELGGSSTQVAFVPDDPALATETLTLDDRSWRLFMVSYLHCGINDARLDLSSDSCFFSGCEQKPECAASLVGTPATRGAGQFGACASTIESGLRGANARCPVASDPRPAMDSERFVLVGNFALLVRSLGAVGLHGEVDLAQLWAAAERTCATAWLELDDPVRMIEPIRRSKICFDAALTHTLLEVYGLSQSTKLVVLDQNPEWALGAAYLER